MTDNREQATHNIELQSSFLAPGWYVYCSCGWTSGPLAYDRDVALHMGQNHQANPVAPSNTASATTFQWLIERGQAHNQEPTIWLCSRDASTAMYAYERTPNAWTETARHAWMFPTKAEAETYMLDNNIPHAMVVEHGFSGAYTPENRLRMWCGMGNDPADLSDDLSDAALDAMVARFTSNA